MFSCTNQKATTHTVPTACTYATAPIPLSTVDSHLSLYPLLIHLSVTLVTLVKIPL